MYHTTVRALSRVLLLGGLCFPAAHAADTPTMPTEQVPPAPRVAPPPARDFAAPRARVQGPDRMDPDTWERMHRVQGISAALLDKGRELYKNLLLAQHAAQKHDLIDLRLGLHDADRVVRTLYRPTAVRALVQQADIIRENLKHSGKRIDEGLWLPLRAELETIRVELPIDRYRAASEALARGAGAAGKGDKSGASAALDQVEQALVQQYVLLPLTRIRGDLRAADNALDPQPPYWKGVNAALQSALDSIRWVTTERADSWMSAYLGAVEAVKAFPDHPNAAQRWLQITAWRLQGLPGGEALANRTLALAQGRRPSLDALYDLTDEIAAHVSAVGNS